MPLSVRRTQHLDLPLKVSAVLLNTKTGVLPNSVWVTDKCRCRLLDNRRFLVLTLSRQLPGTPITKLRVKVLPVVCLIRVRAPPVKLLQVTPPNIAAPNSIIRRPITVTRVCKSLKATLLTGTLLKATRLEEADKACASKPIKDDPFVLSCFISVIALFVWTLNAKLCRVIAELGQIKSIPLK